MNDRYIQRARETLYTSDADLARKLGVTAACLRSWSRRGAPPYVRLALAALIAGLDPDQVWPTAMPLGHRHNDEALAD